MQLHEKIRFFRRSKGLTQEQMAEKLEMTPVAYSNIERGESGILMKRLEEIAQAMDVDLLELLCLGEKNVIILHGDITNSPNSSTNSSTNSFLKNVNFSDTPELQKANFVIEQQRTEIDYLKQQNADLRNMIELLKKKQQNT